MPINKGYLTSNRKASGDEVYTPKYAIYPILKYLPKDKIIWLPFDEDWSNYNKVLLDNGYRVVRSSLAENQDFFKYEPNKWDIIVSNPPFSLKDKILERVYKFNKPFMLLLPLNSLQGQKRYNSFKKGIQLLAFDKRIDFNKKGVAFASAYFCRNILPNDLILEELEKES